MFMSVFIFESVSVSVCMRARARVYVYTTTSAGEKGVDDGGNEENTHRTPRQKHNNDS